MSLSRFEWERLVLSERGPASPITRAILLALATYRNKDNLAWPSIELLATATRFSKHCIVDHIGIAVSEGWIRKSYMQDAGKAWRRSVYTFTAPYGGAPHAPANGDAPDSPASKTGGAPYSDGGVRQSVGGAGDGGLVVQDVHINNVQSTLNNKKEDLNALSFFDFDSKPEQPRNPSGTAQAIAVLEAMKPQPRLQEKPPTVKAAEMGMRQEEGEAPSAYIQRIEHNWVRWQQHLPIY